IWFEILFVFIVLAHDRRRVVHFNVTAHPTAEWTAQQMLEAFPFDTAPKYLLRDRDRIYGQEFRKQVEVIAPTTHAMTKAILESFGAWKNSQTHKPMPPMATAGPSGILKRGPSSDLLRMTGSAIHVTT